MQARDVEGSGSRYLTGAGEIHVAVTDRGRTRYAGECALMDSDILQQVSSLGMPYRTQTGVSVRREQIKNAAVRRQHAGYKTLLPRNADTDSGAVVDSAFPSDRVLDLSKRRCHRRV